MSTNVPPDDPGDPNPSATDSQFDEIVREAERERSVKNSLEVDGDISKLVTYITTLIVIIIIIPLLMAWAWGMKVMWEAMF